MENAPAGILQTNIGEHNLSRSVVHFFEANGMSTLKDLFQFPMADWFSFTGFSQHLLNELMNYFEQRNLTGWIIE